MVGVTIPDQEAAKSLNGLFHFESSLFKEVLRAVNPIIDELNVIDYNIVSIKFLKKNNFFFNIVIFLL